MVKRRKPTHPGIILNEDYIKPLNLNLQKLAERLLMTRNTLFKLRKGKASITPSIAISLADLFDTSPQLWLNLQQNYDLWIEEYQNKHVHVEPLIKNGVIIRGKQNRGIIRANFPVGILVDKTKRSRDIRA
ncbi:MAG TPA: HigA family addiction module antitoxin [Rhabdochlamydiaceae bacterium]|nr:HigA family addiction module antitoxin [Rhabdochlamydiaceae bacterium]